MTNNCIFCKIAQKELPAKIQYQDKEIVAFNDINPKAPVHILIVPKKHIESINTLKTDDAFLIGKMVIVAQKLAKDMGIDQSGFRLIFNTGKNSGQIVDHIHLHLIGGQALSSMV